MPFIPVIAYPLGAIALLVAISLAGQAGEAGRAWNEPSERRWRVGLLTFAVILAWMAFTLRLAASGALADFTQRPPALMLVVGISALGSIAAAFSPLGTRFVRGVDLAVLVGFHAFRLPLEMVMHRANAEGLMPAQMTWTGHNWDVVAGISALLVSLLLRSRQPNRGIALAWNVLGSLLLLNVIVVAIRSLPNVHAYGTQPEQLNIWVAFAPYVWLPTVCVNAALFGHVVLWRKLFARPASA